MRTWVMAGALMALCTSALAEGPPTLGAVTGLSPAAAGDLILAGQTHGVVETLAPTTIRGLMPPGVEELVLIERATPREGACVRRRWTAAFHAAPGAGMSEAALYGATAVTEVGLLTGGACATDEFVRLNAGLTADEALAALAHLGALRTGEAAARFTCGDTTPWNLCATPQTIRAGLAGQKAWAVTRKGPGVELWLGTPGGPITTVTYLPSSPLDVTVHRSIPPPA